MDNDLPVGDLVVIKKIIREILGIDGVGIIIEETKLIPTDIEDLEIEEIDSYKIYFIDLDAFYTIPKGCVEKLTMVQE